MVKKIFISIFALFFLLAVCCILFYVSQIVTCSLAIKNAKLYLQNHTLPSGQFVYGVNFQTDKTSSKYNVLRHAGTIYSMQLLEDELDDTSLIDTKNLAVKYFTDNFIKKLSKDKYIIKDYAPKTSDNVVKLGSLGLALSALSKNSNDKTMLQGLGNSILSLQNKDGSFVSKYNFTKQQEDEFVSLYYPGEACLGLLYLYDIDKQEKWLLGAKSGLLYLAKSRENVENYELPFDHWAIIATKKLLKTPNNTLNDEETKTLKNHVERMVNLAIIQQNASTELKGSFGRNNLCSIATYMEGLASAYYCTDNRTLKLQILKALYRGNKLLRKNQLKQGKYKGGIPKKANCKKSDSKSACKIRIDNVQHSMSGFILYHNILIRK